MQLKIFCDGGARGNPGPAAAAFVVANTSGEIIYKSATYLGRTTNNQAEYTAVRLALNWLGQNHSSAEANFYLDSQLVVNQLRGIFKTKDPHLKVENSKIRELIKNYKLRIKNYFYIPREENFLADTLVNQTLNQYFSERIF